MKEGCSPQNEVSQVPLGDLRRGRALSILATPVNDQRLVPLVNIHLSGAKPSNNSSYCLTVLGSVYRTLRTEGIRRSQRTVQSGTQGSDRPEGNDGRWPRLYNLAQLSIELVIEHWW